MGTLEGRRIRRAVKLKIMIIRTHTLTDAMSKLPFGSAVNKSVESAIAASSPIIHEENSAETLLTLENMLCIGGATCSTQLANFKSIDTTLTKSYLSSLVHGCP